MIRSGDSHALPPGSSSIQAIHAKATVSIENTGFNQPISQQSSCKLGNVVICGISQPTKRIILSHSPMEKIHLCLEYARSTVQHLPDTASASQTLHIPPSIFSQ